MIKLAVMCADGKCETQVLNCLRNEKDFVVDDSIVIRNAENESEKGLAFLKKMTRTQPEITIVDLPLLVQAAAQFLPVILDYTKKCDFTRIIIIGDRFHEQNVIAMVKERVRGFLLREHLETNCLVNCIRLVAHGEIWLSGDLIGRVCDELVRECKQKRMLKAPTREQLDKMKAISRREMEILSLVSKSMTNEEIAQGLFLSPKTVKTHVRNIFEKIDIRNRTEAALLYTRYKQVTLN